MSKNKDLWEKINRELLKIRAQFLLALGAVAKPVTGLSVPVRGPQAHGKVSRMGVPVKAQLPQFAAWHINSTDHQFQFMFVYQVVNRSVKRAHTTCVGTCSGWSNLQKKDRVDRGVVTSLAKRNKAKLDHNSETSLLTVS